MKELTTATRFVICFWVFGMNRHITQATPPKATLVPHTYLNAWEYPQAWPMAACLSTSGVTFGMMEMFPPGVKKALTNAGADDAGKPAFIAYSATFSGR
jgi:hypothetical protein